MSKRRDTRLESEGAEFLVLGNLLLNQIPSYKTYTNMPGYDLVATNPEKNLSVKIQVKSRYKTDWDGFIIKNLDSDFVVFVTLNRGFSRVRKNGDSGVTDPDYYIFPIEYIKQAVNEKSKWGKIPKSNLVNRETYIDNWALIKEKLKMHSNF
tara:strand:- start:2831 stop:3286 length:456 start_codon:yes stop_codon:yes gene_type:complete